MFSNYSVSYPYVSCSASITSVGEERANFLLLFTCNYMYVVSVRRGFHFLMVIGIGCLILLWYYLGLPYNCLKGNNALQHIGYNLNVMRQSAWLVINPIMVDDFAAIFNCPPIDPTSDYMMSRPKAIHFSKLVGIGALSSVAWSIGLN